MGNGAGAPCERTEPLSFGEYPAHAESRRRLYDALEEGSPDRVARVVEADVALALRLLRLANRGSEERSTASVAQAARNLETHVLVALADKVPVEHPLERMTAQGSTRERFRLHALAVRRVTERLAEVLGRADRDELVTAALLHDIGRVALGQGHAPAAEDVVAPEQRVASEERRLGTDHTRVGGALARRWALPDTLVHAIERHHAACDDSPAAVVRLADALVHYAEGRLVDLELVVGLSAAVGLPREDLAELMYELPEPMVRPAPRVTTPCPLTPRELEVLRSLAAGNVYKQIANELGLSASTVRSHLHRIYTRIGAADRTQAVLLAAERGWI